MKEKQEEFFNKLPLICFSLYLDFMSNRAYEVQYVCYSNVTKDIEDVNLPLNKTKS